MPRRAGLIAALLASACAVACARERVEVGEAEPVPSDDAAAPEAESPIFPIGDGGADVVLSTCGPPPSIGRCQQPCPTGYVPLADGAPTCECCP